MKTIRCLPIEEIAPIIGVPMIAKDFVMTEALATRATDARVLYRLAQSIQPAFILEIGTLYGHTTLGLALNSPAVEIFTIDICEEMGISVPESQRIELLPKDQVGMCFQDRGLKINQLFGDSREPELYAGLPQIDLAYIDGNHRYEAIIRDSQNVVEICKSGGLMIWHDYKRDPSVETIVALRKFASHRKYSIYHIQGTWLALMVVP